MNKLAPSMSLLLVPALLLAPALLQAATPIAETRAIDPGAQVSVGNIRGLIRVVGSDRGDVQISGSLGNGAEGLEIEGDADDLSIEVDYPDNDGWGDWWGGKGKVEDTTLVVELPRGVRLKVEAISANVEVEGIDGEEVNIDSISGMVDFRGNAVNIEVDVISGDLALDASAAKRVEVEAVSGDVRIETAAAERVHLESVSGDATLLARGVPLQSLQAATVSGRLNLQAAVAAEGEFKIESMSGDVALQVPANTSANLRVESFSGDIRSAVGKVVKEDMGPGSSLEAALGDGKGRIRIESFSGDVQIKVE